jgi:hypothetical protein
VGGEPISERLAVLETKLDLTIQELDKTVTKINTLHDVYMQAKGANYFMHVLTAMAAFLAAKFSHLLFSTPIK